jgi:succinate-semialdehyde dehydrogenase / glutarate-semialdehyde dehydrogenase
MTLRSVNPTTGALIGDYEEASDVEIRAALQDAEKAFESWRLTPFAERAAALQRTAALLQDRQEELARHMALEMGKPLAQGRAEVEKCAWVCRYYAENGEAFLRPEPAPTDASRSYVAFRPLGPVLAVMPWNFPFWQVFRFAAPALMAGNVGVLKHAANVTACALAIERLLHDAGIPRGAFRVLLISSPRVPALIEAPEIKAVTLTGSPSAGRSVAARAGAVLKKTVLELGGSDAYVILEDADLEAAAEACATARLLNSGQSCIAAKRFVVIEAVLTRFEELIVERMKARRVGDPLEPGVEVGPQARRDLRDDLHQQVQASLSRGARVLLGATLPEGPGAFYPPSVLSGVEPGMSAFNEELFGPVAALIAAKDEQDAIRLANATSFGLGAAVFTADPARGERIAADALEAGSCFVNTFVRSDPRLPFGGIKESGFGRELASFGLREFVNVKSIFVK